MKKLLLLLILSFFSAQGYAGSCPDGSEPVKSVSADGSYFVFNCGGGNSSNTNTNDVDNKSENSTIGQSIYKTITKGNPEIYEAQMLLNRFGVYPSPGKPNGQWTYETQAAVRDFYNKHDQKIVGKNRRWFQKYYKEGGKSFDGKWSSKILTDLQKRRLIVMPRSGPLSFAEKDEVLDEIRLKYDDVTKLEKAWYQLNQLKFDVVTSDEVGSPFCYPTPQDCFNNPGVYSSDPHNAAVGDFNGDGLQDLAISWIYFIHTTKREKTPSHVRFYLNDGENNLISSPEIYALGEVPLRHMLYRMTVNDFNSDGQDDLFAGSMGVIMRVPGQNGLSDREPTLLLLSTENGQMEDASHLIEGQENGGMIKDYSFSHATTSGDINCDGFADIYTGNVLLIGDGTGRFSNKSRDLPQGIYSHQKANSFASTIADFNGDGCGDVVMHLQDKTINVWMSHYGKHLPRTFKELKMKDYYGKGNMKVNHMASGDLDGDGDPDLVAGITRANPYYKGRKILIFINEKGELIEKTKTLIQDVRDQDIKGRPQNGGEGSIRLVDHDRDGDLDIIDSTGGSWEKDGRFGYAIFENDGTGHFTEIPESEFVILREEMFEGYSFNRPQTSIGYPIDIDGIGRLDYVSFIHSPHSPATSSVYGYTVLGRDKPADIEEIEKIQKNYDLTISAKVRKTKDSVKFESSIKKNGGVIFEGEEKFTKFDTSIPLNDSGAVLVGFKDLKDKLHDKRELKVRFHIKYGDIDFASTICFWHKPYPESIVVRPSFKRKDWGGLKIKMSSSACNSRLNGKSTLKDLGIWAVITDLETNAYKIFEALEKKSSTDFSVLLALPILKNM
jgi:hypothetical protein